MPWTPWLPLPRLTRVRALPTRVVGTLLCHTLTTLPSTRLVVSVTLAVSMLRKWIRPAARSSMFALQVGTIEDHLGSPAQLYSVKVRAPLKVASLTYSVVRLVG